MLSGGKVVVFDRFVTIFDQKYGSFRPKILEKNFVLSKSVFDYFKTKKIEKKVTKKRFLRLPLGICLHRQWLRFLNYFKEDLIFLIRAQHVMGYRII